MRPKICVIDSGVGGLSVLQQIDALNPGLDFVYCADKAYFPYGALTEQMLIERVLKISQALHDIHNYDVLVVACNTASTVVLPELRSKLKLPVVGVVPAIKPAALLSAKKSIALIATEATVDRPYTQDMINDFASGCHVKKFGSNKLVAIAEDKLLSGEQKSHEVFELLKDLREGDDFDVAVLACTHFPFLKHEITSCFGPQVELIDSGEAIARRVDVILNDLGESQHNPFKHSIPNLNEKKGTLSFYATKDLQKYMQMQIVFQHIENTDFFNLNV